MPFINKKDLDRMQQLVEEIKIHNKIESTKFINTIDGLNSAIEETKKYIKENNYEIDKNCFSEYQQEYVKFIQLRTIDLLENNIKNKLQEALKGESINDINN